jgi:hypothetical protein
MAGPTLKLEGVTPTLTEVSGLITRVTKADGSALDPSVRVTVECLPMADLDFIYDGDNPVRILAEATAETGFRALFDSSVLPTGFAYSISATSNAGGYSLASGFRKLGRKQACPPFGGERIAMQSTGAGHDVEKGFSRLTFYPLTDALNVPHNANLLLSGSINPYQTGMTLSAFRSVVTPSGPTDEQSAAVVINGVPVDGQLATFTVTILDGQLDPNTNYASRVIADVPHQPAYITFHTVGA